MNISRLQKGLLTWIAMNNNEPKSIRGIKNVCVNIAPREHAFWESTSKFNSEAVSLLFLPLLRLGVVEYCGNNTYALSPTCSILAHQRILTCNVSDNILAPYKDVSLLQSSLGIDLFSNTIDLNTDLRNSNIPINVFNLTELLTQFPTIHNIIEK